MKKFGFLVSLFCMSIVFSGCSLSKNQVDSLVEKYDSTPKATAMADDDIRQNIIGKWQIADKYFDKNLGMNITQEEYNLIASGVWISNATAIDPTKTTEYYFTVEGQWRVSDKQLIVENAVQKTASFNKILKTKQDHYDQEAEINIKTIVDIDNATLKLYGTGSELARSYYRVIEEDEEDENQVDDSSNSTDPEQKSSESIISQVSYE